MQVKAVEVFSEESNYAIVRMPGRQFPGCVIQGDSLWLLLRTARELRQKVSGSSDQDLIDCAQELLDQLQGRMDHYEHVLAEHNYSLPYVK